MLGTSTFGNGWAWTPAAGTFKAFTMDKDKGLVERAKQFRAKAKLRVTGFDVDYYFKRVDGEK